MDDAPSVNVSVNVVMLVVGVVNDLRLVNCASENVCVTPFDV